MEAKEETSPSQLLDMLQTERWEFEAEILQKFQQAGMNLDFPMLNGMSLIFT
jgi:hypothetical protein